MENQVKKISAKGAKKFISGWDQGILDNNKDIAMKMIAIGMTNEQISFSTKLDIRLVLKLRKLSEKVEKEYKTEEFR